MLRTGRARFVACASAFASVGFARPPARAAQFEYKAAHDLAPDHPIHTGQVRLWDAVRRESNGRLNVQVFPRGTLGGQEGTLVQLRQGAIHFLITQGGVYGDVIPTAAIDNLGFAFRSAPEAWNVMDGPLAEYLAKEFDAAGLVRFRTSWDIGMRQMCTSTKPIRTLDDFKGLKLRSPATKIAVEFFRAMGASPTPLDAQQIYVSAQTHIVDSLEAPFSAMWSSKYYEVQKYLSVTSHQFTGEYMAANKEAWKALPADLQAIVERNARQAGIAERLANDDLNKQMPAKLTGLGMVLNTADVTGARGLLRSYYADWKRQFGPTVWALLEDRVGRLV